MAKARQDTAAQALAAIAAMRTAAGDAWPRVDHVRVWSDDEWRAAAGFARVHQALGWDLTARELEAIGRWPDQPAAGTGLNR